MTGAAGGLPQPPRPVDPVVGVPEPAQRRTKASVACRPCGAGRVAEDVALGYKNLIEAERGFRDLKSTLELWPVFHRIEPRIRAHVLLCWLALLLIRVAERRTGLTWRRIALELGRVHAVTLTGTAGSLTQTTPLTEVQQGILRACQVAPPPTVTTLNPA